MEISNPYKPTQMRLFKAIYDIINLWKPGIEFIDIWYLIKSFWDYVIVKIMKICLKVVITNGILKCGSIKGPQFNCVCNRLIDIVMSFFGELQI